MMATEQTLDMGLYAVRPRMSPREVRAIQETSITAHFQARYFGMCSVMYMCFFDNI